MEIQMQVAHLLNDTISPDVNVVHAATESLDRLSLQPHFPYSLLSISSGGQNQGQKLAAATYLKNFTRRNMDAPNSTVSKEFKDQLLQTLLLVETPVLKSLIEVFRIIVVAEFVKKNSWPELVHDLKLAIENSDLSNCSWKAVNAFTVLCALIRPFQYFLNPTVVKEPVPTQLELITKEILVPTLAVFHHLSEKALSTQNRAELEVEKILLIICKCIHFAVGSHMPLQLVPCLPSLCKNLTVLLESLSFDHGVTPDDRSKLRLKIGKRILLIFSSLITRHRKHSDKLMPGIINCALKIAKNSMSISKLDALSEKIISSAFDVISRTLETGPGWRLVSPHFSSLLDSAIFPALVLNERDISEWDEDAEEYLRKNLPSELEEISGWREDLFTARKSAINLLGVISMSKGPPTIASRNSALRSSKRKKGEKNKKDNQRPFMGELLVFPFLAKFPIPSDTNVSKARSVNDYFGVLMAYGGLQDFLKEQKPEYVTCLIHSRLLPLYTLPFTSPYLIAAANWVIGELASCLLEEMKVDIYSSLLKALSMPDTENISFYPVRVSAAGAIAELLENEYMPPEWLPVIQVVISRINMEEEETSILFQLLSLLVEAGDENIADHIPFMVSSLSVELSKFMHPGQESWSQVVEKGCAALAVMVQSWENTLPEEIEQLESNEKWSSGRATIGRTLSALLQQTWLTAMHLADQDGQISATPTCVDDLSTLLRAIMFSVTGSDVIQQLKVSELLLIWADLIANWHAWEESEDLSIFECIKEIVNLHSKYGLNNFIIRRMPSPPSPPVPQQSIIEGVGAFVCEAILQYPSATWRACSCVHMLLHAPRYPSETDVKQSLAISFCQAAFSHFRKIQSNPCALWKPLLLAISSCYFCYPDIVEGILEKDMKGGFTVWGSALASICTSSFEPGLVAKSELKLAVLTLATLIERLFGHANLGGGLLSDCYNSFMEASVRLKEVQEETDDEGNEEAEDDDEDEEEEDEDEDEDYDNEDSEDEELDETEEEFLERYAKAAKDLENGIDVEEGDLEEQEHDIELGLLDELHENVTIYSLFKKFNHLLAREPASPEIISNFLSAFPECNYFSKK